MPTFPSMAAFGRELEAMGREIDGANKRRLLSPAVDLAEKIARGEAVKTVGGDVKFSGWAPTLSTQVKWTASSGAVISPTRSSAGPWTVADQGRNRGNASGFAGPGVNRRTGVTSRKKDGSLRAVRNRKAKRWNGYTPAFGTGAKTVARMERELPDVTAKGFRKVLSKHFDVS